jgi:seryl-tRNA synthetase
LEVYSVEGTDLCLAGTAEIPLGGMYMDSMLPKASLPLKLVALSHCFRTEAGAAGAATSVIKQIIFFAKSKAIYIRCGTS